MPKAHIDIRVELDEKRIPTRILWQSDEGPDPAMRETKALHLSCWDESQQQTLRLELWTQDLRIKEMKRFYIDMLGGMSQGILNATGDEYMSKCLHEVCEKLAAHYKKELSKQNPT